MSTIEPLKSISETSGESVSSQTSVKYRRRILPYLDGLRAVAALWVVAGHTWLVWHGAWKLNTGLMGLALNWLCYPHLAIAIFIVLSGFCLGIPIADNDGRMYSGAWQFYKRRARRILPPLYVAIVFSAIIAFAGKHFGADAATHFSLKLAAANIFLLQDILSSYNTLGPFWSVALEFKIYLLLPLFALVLRRFGTAAMLLLAGLAALGATELLHHFEPNSSLIHSCPWYILLFAFGVIGAKVLDAPGKHVTTVCGLVAILLLVPCAIILHLYPMGRNGEIAPPFSNHAISIDCTIGLFAAFLITYLGRMSSDAQKSPVVWFLSLRPLTVLGTFSYSLYLIHVPIVLAVYAVARHILHHKGVIGGPPLFFLTILLSVGSAYLFYEAFERPFVNIKSHRV